MADRSINELTEALELYDNGYTVVYQDAETKKIAGLALKTYARQSVLNYATEAAAIATADAEAAQKAAETAQAAAESAQGAAETASNNAMQYRDAAKTAQTNAEEAQAAAETSETNASASELNALTYKNSASQSESNAKQYAEDAAAALAAIEVPNITIGTTSTLPAGSDATVTRRPDSPNTAPIFDFGIPKGKDGTGAGDMEASVYDPTGKATDIFAYVDDEISKIPTPDVSAQIQAHNTSGDSHQDIRDSIPTTASQVGADPAGTAQSLINTRLNRTTAVNSANTQYTTYMARGVALTNSSSDNPTINGTILWLYE